MKFCALVLELHLLQNFSLSHTDGHTDRHFPVIVKLCSGHSKMCKSIKNWKSKILTKLIFSSIYIEKSNKNTCRYEWFSKYYVIAWFKLCREVETINSVQRSKVVAINHILHQETWVSQP